LGILLNKQGEMMSKTAIQLILYGIVTLGLSIFVYLDAKGILRIIKRPEGRDVSSQKKINIAGILGSVIFMILGMGMLVLGILFVIY